MSELQPEEDYICFLHNQVSSHKKAIDQKLIMHINNTARKFLEHNICVFVYSNDLDQF